MEFYTLWCEYDYGQQNMLFVEQSHAKIWLKEVMLTDYEDEAAFLREWPNGVQCVFDKRLAGFEVARVFAVH